MAFSLPKGGATTGNRVAVFDLVRGFSVVSMVAFHLCYDLRFILGLDLGWFRPPLQDVWRASISWTFLFVAGCMCAHSRSNLRRAAEYGAAALAIWAVTTVAAVDVPISFGIIYCMAACTFVAWILMRLGLRPKGRAAAATLFVMFCLLQDMPCGSVGIGPVSVEVPATLYETGLLTWLGLPGSSFASGDYYPLLPYLMLFLAGAAMGSSWKEQGYPQWAKTACVRPLNFVGRHALVVYAAHQPLLLSLSALIAG